MKRQFLTVVCFLMSFTVAAGTYEQQLNKLCQASDDDLQLFDARVKRVRDCLKELQPKQAAAMSACNTMVYGHDPQSSVETKKAFCPADLSKWRSYVDCMTGAGVAVEEKRRRAKMSECLKKKANN
ncbi:hypothetical protein BG004_000500 [Podila humilis]|nr:hypothetical protein BG004_000500 [Podila humilis]